MPTVAVVLAQAGDSAPWAPYIGGGSITAIMSFLWWEERKERKEVDRLLRTVYQETGERLTKGLATLDNALDYVEKTERGDRRGL